MDGHRVSDVKSCSFVPYHLDGPFGTDNGTDATAFTIFEVNSDLSRFLIPRNTEIRAEEAARLTGLARSQTQAALSLLDGLFLG